MSTALEKISGSGGFALNATTDARTGLQLESLVVNEDAIFTVFKVGGVDMMTTKKLTGNTLKNGMYLPTDPGKKITDYTLASGSVIEYQ